MASDALLLVYVLHIAGGVIGLASGTVAILAAKGGRLHRAAGKVFVLSMSVMAVLACYLGAVRPDQLANIFIGGFALYLVGTGWLAVRRAPGAVGLAERLAFLAAVLLSAPFLLLSFQLATGVTPFLKSAVPLKGQVAVAIYSFTGVLAIAVLGDAKLVLQGGIAGPPRIARHLWRMGLGLTLATGSAFSNGLARLLPGPYHVPEAFFYPKYIPLALTLFWLIRVRVARRRVTSAG